MGRCYEQFSLEERCMLAQLSRAGKTVRQIAAALDRAPSTIARELKRNSGRQVGYQPAYAEQQAKSRRWRGSRLLRKPDLRNEVIEGLRRGWSPAQVAGRLKKEQRRTVISHETIYRFIDSQIRRTKDYSWRHYLPRGKSKRGWRGQQRRKLGGSYRRTGWPSIGARPTDAQAAPDAGHWEGGSDALLLEYGQAVLVTCMKVRSRLLRGEPVDPTRLLTRWLARNLVRSVRRPAQGPVAPDRYLRQRDGIRPALSTCIDCRCATFFCDRSMRRGKRAASKTPSAACDAGCREKPTWRLSLTIACSRWFVLIITLRESVSTTKPQQRFSAVTCCT